MSEVVLKKGMAMRISIDLPQELVLELDQICARQNISRTEAVKHALVQWTQSHAIKLEDGFGLWQTQPMTDLELAAIREEWQPS